MGRTVCLLLILLLSLESWAQRSYPDLVINGQVQLQLDSDSLGASNVRSAKPITNGIGAFPAADRLHTRRIRLIPILHINPEWTLVNETDFSGEEFFEPEHLKLTLLDLHLRYRFAQGHHLRIGQAKVPFGWELFRSSRTITTIERSDVSRSFFQRDIGVGAFGKGERYEYGAGVYLGEGLNEGERNAGKDMAGRFVYEVAPGLRLGLSGYVGTTQLDNSRQELPERRFGTELHYRKGPWLLEGEYIYGNGINLFSRRDSESRGFYLHNIVTLDEPLDLVLSYDRFDPDLRLHDNSGSNNRTNDRDRILVGLNYYLSRDPVHRFMLNYEIRRELEGPSVSSNGVRLRYQYSW